MRRRPCGCWTGCRPSPACSPDRPGRRQVNGGAYRLAARYLLDGGAYAAALRAYGRALLTWPAYTLKHWHRIALRCIQPGGAGRSPLDRLREGETQQQRAQLVDQAEARRNGRRQPGRLARDMPGMSTQPAAQSPILVTGAHRTGTTWVGKMLAAGPGTAYISEPLNVLHRPGVLSAPVQHWYTYICSENEAQYLPGFPADPALSLPPPGSELRSLALAQGLGRMGRDLAFSCAAGCAASARCSKIPSLSFRPPGLPAPGLPGGDHRAPPGGICQQPEAPELAVRFQPTCWPSRC